MRGFERLSRPSSVGSLDIVPGPKTMRGESCAEVELSQLKVTRLDLWCCPREILPVAMLPLVLCPTIITGEPDECEAGTGDTIVVVAGVDMVVVIAERAGVAPAGVEDVTVVSVVVVSLPFRFAGEAFMILRKTRASGGIRSRFSVVCRLDGTAWEGLDLRDEE